MTEMTDLEIRVYPRKVFRRRATLCVDAQPPINAWTVDISQGGLSLMLAEAIDPGLFCIVKFELVVNGTAQQFSAIARSVYSVCSCTGQYRTGFQFSGLSVANADLIDKMEG